MHIYNVKCQKCGTEVPFLDPKFCSNCGAELSQEAKDAAPVMTDQEWQERQCRSRSW
jgi:rRNA maturation endonuclease Nob1